MESLGDQLIVNELLGVTVRPQGEPRGILGIHGIPDCWRRGIVVADPLFNWQGFAPFGSNLMFPRSNRPGRRRKLSTEEESGSCCLPLTRSRYWLATIVRSVAAENHPEVTIAPGTLGGREQQKPQSGLPTKSRRLTFRWQQRCYTSIGWRHSKGTSVKSCSLCRKRMGVVTRNRTL